MDADGGKSESDYGRGNSYNIEKGNVIVVDCQIICFHEQTIINVLKKDDKIMKKKFLILKQVIEF